ncbi:delta-aminolevulinic acid dehydratase, chloroplastic-like [Hordeum vulgare]|nr:delta-aminolevulinic acid dehydratase, chloroplastic-like [Hordeum vulgare]
MKNSKAVSGLESCWTYSVQARSGRTIEECEADVVAGKFPPRRADQAPSATPEIRPSYVTTFPSIPAPDQRVPGFTRCAELCVCLMCVQDMAKRPRRNRRSPALRAAFQETNITPANLVLPLFIHEGEEDTPIGAMPGCFRLGWRHRLLEEVSTLMLLWIRILLTVMMAL